MTTVRCYFDVVVLLLLVELHRLVLVLQVELRLPLLVVDVLVQLLEVRGKRGPVLDLLLRPDGDHALRDGGHDGPDRVPLKTGLKKPPRDSLNAPTTTSSKISPLVPCRIFISVPVAFSQT